MVACTGLPSLPKIGNDSPPASPTPLGDIISYTVAVYSKTLHPGDKIPGTALEYIQPDNGAFQVRINGQLATKRNGDSFAWKGVVAPGVIGNYNLRLTSLLRGELVAAGQIHFNVLNPQPTTVADFETQIVNASVHHSNIPLQYNVPAGRQIPGTALVFEQMVDGSTAGIGQTMAQLSGTEEYPYFATGDSITWQGQLRPNLLVKHTFRIVQISSANLLIVGTTELWIHE